MNALKRLLFLLTILVCVPALSAMQNAYDFTLKLDEIKHTLSGTARIRYLNDSSKPLAMVRLRLDANLGKTGSLAASTVKDSLGEALSWKYLPLSFGKLTSDKGALEITLSQPLLPGKSACFSPNNSQKVLYGGLC